jgi:hypothetical protein
MLQLQYIINEIIFPPNLAKTALTSVTTMTTPYIIRVYLVTPILFCRDHLDHHAKTLSILKNGCRRQNPPRSEMALKGLPMVEIICRTKYSDSWIVTLSSGHTGHTNPRFFKFGMTAKTHIE